jgi:hypothetical protein
LSREGNGGGWELGDEDRCNLLVETFNDDDDTDEDPDGEGCDGVVGGADAAGLPEFFVVVVSVSMVVVQGRW